MARLAYHVRVLLVGAGSLRASSLFSLQRNSCNPLGAQMASHLIWVVPCLQSSKITDVGCVEELLLKVHTALRGVVIQRRSSWGFLGQAVACLSFWVSLVGTCCLKELSVPYRLCSLRLIDRLIELQLGGLVQHKRWFDPLMSWIRFSKQLLLSPCALLGGLGAAHGAPAFIWLVCLSLYPHLA